MLTLPELPYGFNDLAPAMGPVSLKEHYLFLHANYVAKANALLGSRASEVTNEDLPQLIAETPVGSPLGHSLGQHWNHSFFWPSMTPHYVEPSPEMLEKMDRGYDGGALKLYQDLASAGRQFFASGWLWLTWDESTGKFAVETTEDGVSDSGGPPERRVLLTLDLWEHAYYYDYLGARARYIDEIMSSRWNWPMAEERMKGRGLFTEKGKGPWLR